MLVIHSYRSLVNFILNCDQVDVSKIYHEFCFSMFPVSDSLFQLFADIRLVFLFRYAECAARHVPGCKRFYFELFLEMKSFLYRYIIYADDTYLVVPASKSGTIESELQSIASWSESNNVTLNTKKSTEIVIYKPKSKNANLPLPLFLEYKQ